MALFAYDTGTFIVQNFSAVAADVNISTLGNSMGLKNIVNGEMIEGKMTPSPGWNRQDRNIEDRVSFPTHLPPHSYAAFSLETGRGEAMRSSH